MLKQKTLLTFLCLSVFATTLGWSADDRSRTDRSRTAPPRVERASQVENNGPVTAARIIRDRFVQLLQIARLLEDDGEPGPSLAGLSDDPDPVSAKETDNEDPADNATTVGDDGECDGEGRTMMVLGANEG